MEHLLDPKLWIGIGASLFVGFVANKLRIAANSVIAYVGAADTDLRYLKERSDQLWNIHTVRDDSSLFQVNALLRSHAHSSRLLERALKYQAASFKLALLAASDEPEITAEVSKIQQELTEALLRE